MKKAWQGLVVVAVVGLVVVAVVGRATLWMPGQPAADADAELCEGLDAALHAVDDDAIARDAVATAAGMLGCYWFGSPAHVPDVDAELCEGLEAAMYVLDDDAAADATASAAGMLGCY